VLKNFNGFFGSMFTAVVSPTRSCGLVMAMVVFPARFCVSGMVMVISPYVIRGFVVVSHSRFPQSALTVGI
jgi:hypothetical protein